jgi:cytosine/adenosine deaminase-related metal-dependent hydrolase
MVKGAMGSNSGEKSNQANSMDTCTFSGRWVFPVNGPPLERGTVTIAGPRILAVDASGRRRPAQDFENAAILPGFVNAHTHLDLCGLRGKIQPGKDFFDWLRAVIQHRRSITQDQLAADIQAGIRECGRYGTTAIGDISGQGMSLETLADFSLVGAGQVFDNRSLAALRLSKQPKHR